MFETTLIIISSLNDLSGYFTWLNNLVVGKNVTYDDYLIYVKLKIVTGFPI